MTTWNPADKRAEAALTNGNRTISGTIFDWCPARSTTSKTSGNVYWEVTADVSAYQCVIALVNATASLSIGPTDGSNGSNGLYIYNNGGTTGAGTFHGLVSDLVYTTGDVLSFVLNVSSAKLTVYRNGVIAGFFDALPPGDLFIGAWPVNSGTSDQMTMRTATSQFSYPVPSDTGAWDVEIAHARQVLIMGSGM